MVGSEPKPRRRSHPELPSKIFLDKKCKYVFNAAQRFVSFEGDEPPNHFRGDPCLASRFVPCLFCSCSLQLPLPRMPSLVFLPSQPKTRRNTSRSTLQMAMCWSTFPSVTSLESFHLRSTWSETSMSRLAHMAGLSAGCLL